MKRVLTTVLAVALLLGLGALAVLAMPSANAPLAAAPVVSAAAPEAVDAEQNFNMIAMPLDASDQFIAKGYPFDQDGLAQFVGSGVLMVLKWDAPFQRYLVWTIDPDFGGSGDLFNLEVGGAYWVLLNSSADDIVSFVGDVPDQGSVQFNFTTAAQCKFNQFSVPLDQAQITNQDELATALNATLVGQWNATLQRYEVWTVDPDFGGSGDPFPVKIGYPYMACLGTGSPTVWPLP